MRRLIPILALALCLCAVHAHAESPEDLRAALAASDGVLVAVIQANDKGEIITEPMVPVVTEVDGQRVQVPMPGTEGYRLGRITYIVREGDVINANTVAIAIAPDDSAAWHNRPPSVLRVPEAPPRVGGDADIVAAVEVVAGAAVQKPQIMHGVDSAGAPYADVTGYVESSGRLARREYHVRADERGALVVKAYDAQAATEPVSR